MGDEEPRQKLEYGKRRYLNDQYEDGYSIEQLHDHTTTSQQFDGSCRCSVFGSLCVKVALAIARTSFHAPYHVSRTASLPRSLPIISMYRGPSTHHAAFFSRCQDFNESWVVSR
jgi:hypothetical protein